MKNVQQAIWKNWKKVCKKYGKLCQNGSQMELKWIQNGTNIISNWIQNTAKMEQVLNPNPAKMKTKSNGHILNLGKMACTCKCSLGTQGPQGPQGAPSLSLSLLVGFLMLVSRFSYDFQGCW